MQDTNKNAIWIFVVIIVVLGLIWATSSKPKSTTPSETASTTPVVSGDATASSTTSASKETVAPTAPAKSPTLPKAGVGPKN